MYFLQIASLIAHHLHQSCLCDRYFISPHMGRDEKAAVLRRHFICRPVSVDFARIIVYPVFYPLQFFDGQLPYICSLWNKPPKYPVPILIAPALPAAVWVGVIDLPAFRCFPDRFTVQELTAVVSCDCFEHLGEIAPDSPPCTFYRRYHFFLCLVLHQDIQRFPRLSLHKCQDSRFRALPANYQVDLPMPHGLRMNEQPDKVDEIIPKNQKEFCGWGRIR